MADLKVPLDVRGTWGHEKASEGLLGQGHESRASHLVHCATQRGLCFGVRGVAGRWQGEALTGWTSKEMREWEVDSCTG